MKQESMKDYSYQAWLADWQNQNQQARSLGLVEQDWREHTAQTHNKTARKTTQQHYSATRETCNKREKIPRISKQKLKVK